jgi:hypothetical protein
LATSEATIPQPPNLRPIMAARQPQVVWGNMTPREKAKYLYLTKGEM